MEQLKDNTTNSDQPDDFFRNINIQLLIHELKGPVDVIETNNRMLLENEASFGKLTASQARILKRSVRNTTKLRDMLHSLLEVGASQNGRVDIHCFPIFPWTREVVKDSLEIALCEEIDKKEYAKNPIGILRSYGLELTCSPGAEEALVNQDKNKYSHILGNLLRNALQHRQKRIQVDLGIENETFKVVVSDDGPGIGEEERETIFIEYSGKKTENALRSKGHGLGLASSRILARFLGGDIHLSTEHINETHFVLTLPMEFSGKGHHEVHVHTADD